MGPITMESTNALPTGHRLHEYQIDRLLGAGGFGLTYLATDANLNLQVALKEYLPGDFATRHQDNTVQAKSSAATETFQTGLKRFMDEARTLASFHHANIVRVMRFFEANQTGYMVMEFVDGTPLTDWVAARRPLSQEEVFRIVEPILDGLDVIHKAGYLHRDIKPANIYVRADNTPVLLDFGSARHLMGAGQELTVMVSPGFAPIEQYHGNGKQGPWTDLYALAGVMYWMVTGAKPMDAVARVRVDDMPPAMRLGAGGYSQQLLAAIDWALKPEESDRPQSVGVFRRTLKVATDRGPTEAPVAPAPSPDAATILMRPEHPHSTTGLTGVVLDHGEVKRIESELAQRIGPIAAVVVRNAAKTAPTLEALVETVSREITDDAERTAFLRKFGSGNTTRGHTQPITHRAPDHTVSVKFPAEFLKAVEADLAQYIGAIARVVVKRAAAQAIDETEFYLCIADEIHDPAERKKFVRRAVSISTKK